MYPFFADEFVDTYDRQLDETIDGLNETLDANYFTPEVNEHIVRAIRVMQRYLDRTEWTSEDAIEALIVASRIAYLDI